jgi:hypothetical protein
MRESNPDRQSGSREAETTHQRRADERERAERDHFLDWWISRGGWRPTLQTNPGHEHEYENPIAEAAWQAWRHRAGVADERSAAGD